MANMEKQFQAAMDAPDPEGASLPAEQPGTEEPDMTCPCCGASAMKIVQAAQGGGGQPPM
jgi:hypothetical protein